MKTKISAIISGLVVILVFSNSSFGNGINPDAVLFANPGTVVVGEEVTLDGSYSTDSDGTIVECSWDWTNDGIWDYTESIPPGDKKANHAYTSLGEHEAELRVKDNDGLYDYDTCIVNVVRPSAPTLISPSNGSICQSIDGVTLSWSTVSGADSYKVYFGTNTTPPCVNDVNTTSWSTGTLQPYTRYYWKIKTHQNGFDSEDSSLWYFTTCSLTPGQATDLRHIEIDGDIIIGWTADPNAGSHNIYLGTNPNNLHFQTNQTTTSFNLGPLSQNIYYWRIDEVSECGCTVTEGQVCSFTIYGIWHVNNAVSGGLNNGVNWANAFYDLQSALDVADPNTHEIWIAKGWEGYYPSKETISGDGRSATFQLASGLRIYGGFDGTESYRSQRDLVNNITILSGDRGNLDDISDNCYHVVTCQDVNGIILDGLTIKKGYATGSDSNSDGAGLYCDNSTITLSKCVVAENIANSNGGGIYCEDSNIVLADCVVIENEADKGGGIYDFNSSSIVTNCTFSENSVSDDGGGMYNYSPSSEPNVSNSIFWGNLATDLGDQIYNNSADPNFSYCDIEDSNSGGSWDTNLGNNDGGNIDVDPVFIASKTVNDLVAHWSFNEGSGLTTSDLAGSNDANLAGNADWVDGVTGYALTFNGIFDYAEAVDYKGVTGTASRTVAAWIKTDTDSAIVFWGGDSAGQAWSFTTHYDVITLSVKTKYTKGSTNIQDDQWHHVAAVLEDDGSPDVNEIKLYVDGIEETISYSDDYAINTTSDANVTIGGNPGYYWRQGCYGEIDEVTIYDKALSLTEIRQLYQYGLTGYDDYHLDSISPCINTGDPNGDYDSQYDASGQTRLKVERIDMGAYEASWTVHNTSKGSWGKWYDSIQEAIDDANNTDEIVAYPATYYETIDFNDMAITLRGMEPNDWNNVAATIIDANCDFDDPNTYGHVVTFDDGEDCNSILMGFTITGGYASGTSDANNGGGIYCNGSSPTISKCIISENIAIGIGGGMYDCNSSSPVITNCIFSENDANNGGGIYNLDSSPTLTNCTFGGNYASDHGGGVYDSNSDIVIKNSILYHNSAYSSGDQIYNDSSDPNISYCNIKGCKNSSGVWDPNFGLNGGGNTNYAPYFVDVGGYSYFEDTGNRDYHLLNYSPCIDNGDPCSSYAYEPNDPNNTRINMGAYGDTQQAELAGEDSDSDNLPDDWELIYWPYHDPNLHDPNDDSDSDDVNNLQEYHIGTYPNNSDTDNDGISDGWEYEYNLEPLDADDAFEDGDNDGLTNLGEYEYGTSPDNNDTDSDQIPDGWEVSYSLDPLDANDANDDDDGDNLTNLQEYNIGTAPDNNDVDNDGMPDGWEYNHELDPLDSNSTNQDYDDDGYTNLSEYLHNSDPNDGANVPSSNITIDVPDDIDSIQSAIYASIDDDTIEVAPGTYFEAIDFNSKAITLTGTDPNDWDIVESTIIDGEGASAVVKFEHSEEANSILEGITVTGGGRGIYINLFCSPTISNCVIRDNNDTGTFLFLSDPNISNCVFKSNSGIFGGGIYNLRSSPKITNCIFSQNTATTLGGGICNQVLSYPTITNCTFSKNTSNTYGGGIYNNASSSPVIKNSIFWDNTASTSGGEIYNYDDNSDPNFSYCDIEGGINGTKCGGPNSVNGGGNINSDPYFFNADNQDYHLLYNSPCINTGDPDGDYSGQFDIDGDPRDLLGRVDIGADEGGTVHNITTDLWYATIQAAIDDASEGDVIEVKQGTYYENIDFNGVSCTVRSIDPNDWEIVTATIIDANDPNAAVVKFETSEDINSVLKGFTITGGDPGIYCDGTSPTISNCMIKDNNSSSLGGGMYDVNSSPTVTDCFFIDNDANNGGGIYDYNSSPMVVNCVFSGNLGREDGGGMYNYDSSPILVNCTFSNNDANNGGGMYNYDSSSEPNVSNSIFWGNSATDSGNQIYNSNNAEPNFSYCDIEDSNSGGSWDTSLGNNDGGNLDLEPYFLDANDYEGSDNILGTFDDGLAVSFYSPCVNAGSNGKIPGGVTTDIKGDSRIIGTVDIGTYEYTGPASIICVAEDANGGNDGTSWIDAYTDLQDALAAAASGDEIWVVSGVYFPSDDNDRSDSFELVEDVVLYGGFSGNENFRDQRRWLRNKTVLSGDLGTEYCDADNSYHVVVGADNATLDGFVITAGNANGGSDDDYGGGIYCKDVSPTIKNCIISDNQALYDGGGMYFYCNSYESVSLTNCILDKNVAGRNGGGVYRNNKCAAKGILNLANCVFTDNTAESGGACIFMSNDEPSLVNCTFNQSDATDPSYEEEIYLADSDINLKNCVIWNQNGESPISIRPDYKTRVYYKWKTVYYSEYKKRVAGYGIEPPYGWSWYERFINSEQSKGMSLWRETKYRYYFDPDFPNERQYSISYVWYWGYYVAKPRKIKIPIYKTFVEYNNSSVAASYCNIKGGYSGTGNINNDPCFVDWSSPTGSDGILGTPDDGMKLTVNSSCIDAAYGNTAPSTDIFGIGRVDINSVSNTGQGNPRYADMGAFELCAGIDTDGDGMEDDWEIYYDLDKFVNDANDDADSDSMSNGWEYQYNLDPTVDDANNDADHDGITNGTEYEYGFDPSVNDANDDLDNDHMSNIWELNNYLNPADANDANDDPDGDNFVNLVEYLFGYDPCDPNTENMDIESSISQWSNFDSDVNYSQIDPTASESLNIEYWLNMDANVIITIKNTDTSQTVRTIDEGYKTAGWHEVQWDGTDNDSNLVERYFYDIDIAADDGVGGTDSWQSPDGGNTSYYDRSTNRTRAYTNDFDAYRNIPVDIRCDMLDFAKRTIDVVEDDNPSSSINTVINDRLLEPGWNSFDWYGYWDTGPNNGDLCEQAFDIYFDTPAGVNKGSVLVYYDSLLTDLRCQPYRILALSDEAATISYDLAYDSDVTITITDPGDNSFVLLDSQSQLVSENPQEITLHGTSDPGDPNSVYLSNEGVYRIEVEVENDNITEKLEGSITVYR